MTLIKIITTENYNNSLRLSCCVAEKINGVNNIELFFTHNFDNNLLSLIEICLFPK